MVVELIQDMKKQILYIILLLLTVTPLAYVSAAPVYAQCAEDEIETSTDLTGEGRCVPKGNPNNISENPIIVLIAGFVRFLSVGVGIAVTISIVVSGIQYMASRGNPQSIQAAQSRLWNAIIALLLFIFMTVIINFLIPGGVF